MAGKRTHRGGFNLVDSSFKKFPYYDIPAIAIWLGANILLYIFFDSFRYCNESKPCSLINWGAIVGLVSLDLIVWGTLKVVRRNG